MNSDPHSVLRVTRTKAQAKASYDRMSPFYDYFAGVFEQKYRNAALKQLNIASGEIVLEIGFGTGHACSTRPSSPRRCRSTGTG